MAKSDKCACGAPVHVYKTGYVGNRCHGCAKAYKRAHKTTPAQSKRRYEKWKANQTPEQREEWQRTNAARARAYYAKNPKAYGATAKAWRSRNRATVARLNLHNKIRGYGITPDVHDALLFCQDGVCAICKRPETLTRLGKVMSLSIDHHHGTDRVRGLLCGHCNRSIGGMGEDPARLRAAAEYLERYAQ